MTRGFYSIQPRGLRSRWQREPERVGPDPYSPSSEGYRERNRKTVTHLPGGLVREDIGHPVGAPQPTPVAPAKPAAPPPAPTPTSPSAAGLRMPAPRLNSPADWRRDCGLMKSD